MSREESGKEGEKKRLEVWILLELLNQTDSPHASKLLLAPNFCPSGSLWPCLQNLGVGGQSAAATAASQPFPSKLKSFFGFENVRWGITNKTGVGGEMDPYPSLP